MELRLPGDCLPAFPPARLHHPLFPRPTIFPSRPITHPSTRPPIGTLFQIAGAAHRKVREPVTVLVRVAHSKLELELCRVR